VIITQDKILQYGVDQLGGKAFALALSCAQGAKVPEFFVVTAQAATPSGQLNPCFHAEIEQAINNLLATGATIFAVRSSARSEDGVNASHAGQFLTLLNQSPQQIIKAIEAVFMSGLAAHIAEYRKAQGFEGDELPSVIVQRQIEARSAGVAFSADPVSGRRDIVVVSAIDGLGERLVSGEEDGENWHIGKVVQDIFLSPPFPEILTQDEARAVAKLCIAAEQRQNQAQDIEWAIDKDGQLWHLQNRPITSCLRPYAREEERLLVLDNSNIVESYPGLVSPLTFSFAATAYDRVYRSFLKMIGTNDTQINMARPILANMLVLYQGRLYYNLGNWYRLLSFLPFLGHNRQNMEAMMGVSSPIPQQAITDIKLPSFAQSLRMVGYLALRALFLPRIVKKFYQRINQVMQTDHQSLDNLSLSQLAQEYRRLEAALLDRWDAPILNDVLCMMAYGASRKLLEKYGGQEGIALHNEVMIGQGSIISAEPAKLIREMGQIVRLGGDTLKQALSLNQVAQAFSDNKLGPKLHAYLAHFGDRRVGELKLESPTLHDDPTPLLAAINAAAAKEETSTPTSKASIADINAIFGGNIVKKWSAKFLLAYAKARVRDRENLRFERTHIFTHARRIFLKMGAGFVATAQLERAEDIFFLTLDEVIGSIEGYAASHHLQQLVALRQAEQAAYQTNPEPPERVLIKGQVGDKARRIALKETTAMPDKAATQNPLERQGIACGSGRVRAKVRIIIDPTCQSLQEGEILVARSTDPGWISHFVNAAAVVVERGSILSHSAIVSRELGIPCVVGVKGACEWLQNGEWVEVDGSTGMVKKCLKK